MSRALDREICWLCLPPAQTWGDSQTPLYFCVQHDAPRGPMQKLHWAQLAQLPTNLPLYCVLHPLDTILQKLNLPRAPSTQRQQEQAAPWLLEPFVLSEPDALHVRVVPEAAEAVVNTLAVAKSTLHNLLQRLQAVRLKPSWVGALSAWLVQAAPCLWHDQEYTVIAARGHLPLCLAHQLNPEMVAQYAANLAKDSAVQTVQAPALPTIQTMPATDWADWLEQHNLLSGAFSKQRAHGRWQDPALWRRPLGLTLAVLLCYTLGINLYWWQLTRQSQTLRTQVTQAILQTLPQLTVLYEPLAQVKRTLALLHSSASGSMDNVTPSLLGLLQRASPALSTLPAATLRGINYQNQTLQLRFIASQLDMTQRQQLQRTWQEAGLSVEWELQNGSEQMVLLRLHRLAQ